jgi:sterol O-acyltransferase
MATVSRDPVGLTMYASLTRTLPVSELYRKHGLLRTRLRQLEKQNDHRLAYTGHTSAVHTNFNSELTHLKRHDEGEHSADLKDIHDTRDTDHLLSLAETIENNTPLAPSQMRSLKPLLQREIELLSEGLCGQFSSCNHYPRNLTIANFCDFITLPTLVYELEYPRTERVNWAYVAEKSAATFGTIVVMIVVSQNWIYPVVMSTLRMKEEGLTVQQRLQEFPWVLSDLLFPFMVEYLLAFYVIWECVVSGPVFLSAFI